MGLSNTLASTVALPKIFGAKESAALYFEARARALADARLKGGRVTKAAEQKYLELLKKAVVQNSTMLDIFVKRHNDYLSCPTFDAQNVFMRRYVDKKIRPKVEAAVYFEAHARALAFARLNKDTNVRQFERRIEDVLLKEVVRNPDLLKAVVKKHDDYVACQDNKQGAFIKKYVDEKTKNLRSISRDADSVKIIYPGKKPSCNHGHG